MGAARPLFVLVVATRGRRYAFSQGGRRLAPYLKATMSTIATATRNA